jgi:phosphoserine phosphatase
MAEEHLTLWHDGDVKATIQQFVVGTTSVDSPNYVAPADRVAVFDNDGTLWTEMPMYIQLRFALDRARTMSMEDPTLLEDPIVEAAVSGNMAALAAGGMSGIARLVALTHTGITTEALAADIQTWISTARHPRFDRLYTELIYEPQLQLMAYLRAHGFKVYIVSGGGIEFMRAWVEDVYNVPREMVIGSSVKTAFEVHDGRGVLVQLPEIHLVDDGPGKPVGINQFIGRRPAIAVGNSDGDLEMLQYTTTGHGPGLAIYIHHDDAEREYAYDRESTFGKLDKGLDEAERRGWTVVSMRRDWRRIFAHEA